MRVFADVGALACALPGRLRGCRWWLTCAACGGTPSVVSETSHPVTVAVRRPDGSVEHVRVGTAVRDGDGFRLSLGDLSIGAGVVAAAPARRASSASSTGGGSFDGGMVFPPYGRSKGAPIAGASRGDLEFYANGCRRTLNDPAKSRWHDKERSLLAAIEAEMARQDGGGDDGGGAPPFRDDDRGPPGDEDIPF